MEQLVQQLAQQAQQRYYGKYRGFVTDNRDPEKRGRLKVKVPTVLGEQDTGWALPCLPFGGLANQGLFMVPEIDAQVWVEFEEGNLDHPVWVGVFWQQSSDTPEEAMLDEPTTRMLRTPSGHVLQFDDLAGEEKFRLAHPAGTEMRIDPKGTVELEDAAGAKITMDAESNKIIIEDSNGNKVTMDSSGTLVEDSSGNKIEMAPSGIVVKAIQIEIKGEQVHLGGQGGEPLIKAQTFMAMYNSHTHLCTAPGSPSAPPLPPLTPAAMTIKSKAQ
ncbi:MAG: phage baseplate assembly protein V [Gammaproteobacteria bacterium]|nr:phage baseplate assembly protein V [Gammaproteobacteria bacterium]